MQKKLNSGKLPSAILKKLIQELPTRDSSILIPAGIGFDAAGIKIGEQFVAITTDPITLATEKIGTYSVAVNVNDVACLGCKPRWYSATLLLPIGITEESVEAIWQNLAAELKRYDICAIGGHTEVTSAVNTPVIVGQMIGEVIGEKLLDLRNARTGDKILLWRPIAIEGTAVLAQEKQALLEGHFSKPEIEKMQNLIVDPGICIWPMVEKLIPCDGVVAIHDPTEGGVATALHELADATNLGMQIYADAISILPETKKLAELLHFDPLGFLASGSALIVCKADAVDSILQRLSGEQLTVIGEFTQNSAREMILQNAKQLLPRYDRDEIARIIVTP